MTEDDLFNSILSVMDRDQLRNVVDRCGIKSDLRSSKKMSEDIRMEFADDPVEAIHSCLARVLDVPQIKALCIGWNLSDKGRKDELIERLINEIDDDEVDDDDVEEEIVRPFFNYRSADVFREAKAAFER